VIGQASRYRWRNPERFVDSGEIVMHGVNRNHVDVIFDLLGKSVC
jgi:hypothetical protein